MKGINYLTADKIKRWDMQVDTIHGWKLARPLGRTGINRRFKMAWLVFTGECDVLSWHKQ